MPPAGLSTRPEPVLGLRLCLCGVELLLERVRSTRGLRPALVPVFGGRLCGAGHIHLLVTGQLSIDQDPPGVYHLEWDGNNWSSPLSVYKGSWYPQYPHIVIDRGNQLHATWFIGDSPWEPTTPYQVWYAHGRSQSPAETPVPPPTSTPTPTATPLATATPTATPYPTLAPVGTALPDGLYTESDDLMRLLVGLAPVLILATAIFAVRFGWLRRSSGR